MCFVQHFNTKEEAKKAIKPLIATRAIRVFKSLSKDYWDGRGIYSSPWRSHCKWKRGDHLYQEKENAKDKIFGIRLLKANSVWRMEINEGLHSAKTKWDAERAGCGAYTFEMIIPKGSKYYFNGTVYVSDNLIFPHIKRKQNGRNA